MYIYDYTSRMISIDTCTIEDTMCFLNILFGLISEDVAALMGILYTMSLQIPVFLS